MKSKHRHELKTNELAEWLANFPQWIKENHKTIIGIVVLIIVIIGYFSWKSFKISAQEQERLEFTSLLNSVTQTEMETVNAQMQGNDVSYMLLQRAGDLKKFAEKTRNNNIAAISLIKQADAIRAELHYRMGDISEQVLTEQINQAKTSYIKAIELSSSDNSLRAIATFGLGLCAEELGNFNEARQIYQDLADNPDFEGTVTAIQAELRLKTMSDYENDIVFLPAPIPEPVIASTPQVQVIPADPNMPLDMNSIGAHLPFDINMANIINTQTDSNLPIGANLEVQSNIPDSNNLSTEVDIAPVIPAETPQAPDLETVPEPSNNISEGSDINVPIE